MNPQNSSLLEFLKDLHKDEQAEKKSLKYNELTGSKENDTPEEVLSNFSMILIPKEEVPNKSEREAVYSQPISQRKVIGIHNF